MNRRNMIVVGVVVSVVAMCIGMAGLLNERLVVRDRLARHEVRPLIPGGDLEMVEHKIREITFVHNASKRRKMLVELAREVIELDFAKLHARKDPCSVLISYNQYVNSVARSMRDCGEPEVVVEMMVAVGRRIENEKKGIRDDIQRWCELVPSEMESGTNDARVVDVPEERRKQMSLAIEGMRHMRIENLVTNAFHVIDCIQHDRRNLIEQQVIPYYTYNNSDSNQVERLQKIFRDYFGQNPRKRALVWR